MDPPLAIVRVGLSALDRALALPGSHWSLVPLERGDVSCFGSGLVILLVRGRVS